VYDVSSADHPAAARASQRATRGRSATGGLSLNMSFRHVPLVVIASPSTALADSVASQLRREGNVVYVTHSV
jgi:hypothetical protein